MKYQSAHNEAIVTGDVPANAIVVGSPGEWCDTSKQKTSMSDQKVPFLDLVTVHREMQDEFVEILKTALSSAGFIGGPMVQGFEQDFARFCESRHRIGINSGTDAFCRGGRGGDPPASA